MLKSKTLSLPSRQEFKFIINRRFSEANHFLNFQGLAYKKRIKNPTSPLLFEIMVRAFLLLEDIVVKILLHLNDGVLRGE